jgi:hypothetical protein
LSNSRAIAAVTSTLVNMLFQAVSTDADLAGALVTALPPDRARQGGVAGNQINLFLYRTSIDAAWRNQDPPGIRPGEAGQPALPLVLSYLMTAYGQGEQEVLAQKLLGVGMELLNDQPLLFPADIAAALAGSGLEDQPDRVRITPHPIPMDEISRLWSTFGTGYRMSATYDAAVVLIDSTRPRRAPLPVLARSTGDAGPHASAQVAPFVQLVAPPLGQPGARPGDTVVLTGQGLGGVTQVQLSGAALAAPVVLDVSAVSDQSVSVTISAAPPLPASMVAVTALTAGADGSVASNAVPLQLMPVLTNTAPLTGKLVDGSVTLVVDCSPPVVGGQSVALVVGSRIVPGAAGVSGRSLSFTLSGFAAGSYVVRLRVDGQDSFPLAARRPDFDPARDLVFDPTQTLVLS